MRYLTVDEVAQINRSVLREGEPFVPKFGLLEAAIMRPQQSVFGSEAYGTIHLKAAALMHSLALNHAFAQGNKRTALVAVVAFYRFNDWWLVIDDSKAVDLTMRVVEGDLDVPRLAEELERYAHRLPPPREY